MSINNILASIGVIDAFRAGWISGWIRFDLVESVGIVSAGVDKPRLMDFDLHARPDLGAGVIGFRAQLPEDISTQDIVTERVLVVLLDSQEGSLGVIKLWKVLAAALSIGDLKEAELKVAVDWLEANRREQAKCLANLLTGGGGESLASKVSEDRSAVMSENGQYFLYRGNNDLLAIYQAQVVPERLVDEWCGLVVQRLDRVSAIGSRFIQAWIPEKSSYDSRSLPFRGEIPSLLYKKITARIKGAIGEEHSMDFLESSADPNNILAAVYRRTDSHFSSYGAEIFIRYALKVLGFSALELNPGGCYYKEIVGDLSMKFKSDPLDSEPVQLWSYLTCNDCRVDDPSMVSAVDPKEGNSGARRVFINNSAPIDGRMIVFGNSFFERGGNSSSISWWFARIFKEFHFIWASELDCEYINENKPDFVVCQTIERFTNRVPLF